MEGEKKSDRIMKAKKVYEEIGFKRGKEPLDSLGLGIKSMKQLGPLEKRPTHILKKDDHILTSRGYLLWKLLNFIKNRNDEGIPVGYNDCVQYYYHQFKNEPHRTTFGMGPRDNLNRYIDRDENKKYHLNRRGLSYLDKYSFFDDQRETLSEGSGFMRGTDPKDALSLGQWKDGYIVEEPGQYTNLHLGIFYYFDFNNYTWTKKPWAPDEIKETEVTTQIEKEIEKLPILSFKDYEGKGNILGLLDDWPEDFKYRDIPFIANILSDPDRTFLVDPEGFSYARYITELI